MNLNFYEFKYDGDRVTYRNLFPFDNLNKFSDFNVEDKTSFYSLLYQRIVKDKEKCIQQIVDHVTSCEASEISIIFLHNTYIFEKMVFLNNQIHKKLCNTLFFFSRESQTISSKFGLQIENKFNMEEFGKKINILKKSKPLNETGMALVDKVLEELSVYAQ